MPSSLMPDEVELAEVNDDVFSYMCSLAMEKCSKKSEKKRASCGGEAMRRRLLIKNFVAQMIAHERQNRTDGSPPPAPTSGEEDTGEYEEEEEDEEEEDSSMESTMDADDGRLSMVVSERPHEQATNCVPDADEDDHESDGGREEDDGSSGGSSSGDDEEEENDVDSYRRDGDRGAGRGEEGDGANGSLTGRGGCGLQSTSLAQYPPFGAANFYPIPFPEQRAPPPTTLPHPYGCFTSTENDWVNLHAQLRAQDTGDYNDATFGRYDGSPQFTPAGSSPTPQPSSSAPYFYPTPSSGETDAATSINAAGSSTVVVVAEEVREELRLGEMSLLEDAPLEREQQAGPSQLIAQSDFGCDTTATTVRAFASLSNVAFSAATRFASCRSEFLPSVYRNLHHQSKSITDLDTHITVLEQQEEGEEAEVTDDRCLDASTDSGSPRKRHLPLLAVGGGGPLYSTCPYGVPKLAKRFKL